MSVFQLTEYVLWKTIKQDYKPVKREIALNKEQKSIVFDDDMICRVCTNPADVPVTNKIYNISILTAIRDVANISITDSDIYPKYVCNNCLIELKTAITFKRKCEASDYLFRRSFSSDTILVNNNPPIVIHDFASILHEMKQKRLAFHKHNVKHKHYINVKNEILNPIHTQRKNPRNKLKTVTKYKCKTCDLIFNAKDSLLEHQFQNNCIHPPCPLCGKLVSNLTRHKKMVHYRTDKYTCHICGKISYSSGGLHNHLLAHSDNFRYSCPICPYKGKQQAYLTLHMRIHTGERPYLCSECPAKFVNPSNLRKHQLTHSSKKFKCIKCNKQFRLQKTLQEHIDAAHLNVRYRCSVCGRDLWTRRKLLSHELRVHNREKHKLYEEMHKVVLNEESN